MGQWVRIQPLNHTKSSDSAERDWKENSNKKEDTEEVNKMRREKDKGKAGITCAVTLTL